MKNKKALIIGIDYYQHNNCLNGCTNDALKIAELLEYNEDESKNFSVMTLIAKDKNSLITRKDLKASIEELFSSDCEVALLYYSGHGYVEKVGGYLVTSECEAGDGSAGMKLDDVVTIAQQSKAKNKILILDSCHAGAAGSPENIGDNALLAHGMTILAASGKDQYALETGGSGVFTTLLADALEGGAANLLGHITPGSVYAHIDQSLGLWQQRPVFKTNVSEFTNLRTVAPPISLKSLKMITQLFKNKDDVFALNPSYEEYGEHEKNPDNMKIFKILQAYNRVNLVVPAGADHMYWAAMLSKGCKLTTLGIHYWKLVTSKAI